ncbi:MAG: fibronectin type III domain-containing protein [Bacteroidales bacterium]|nr:fibronectin type III domain-containing protein [Bacteroidales bacterium]
MKKHLLSLLALVALALPMQVFAQAHIVADGTNSNEYVPVYGYYLDDAQHNQIVYHDSLLTDLRGESIAKLVYYLSQLPGSSWTNTVTVRMMVVQEEAVINLLPSDSAQLVYTGGLAIEDDNLVFDLDQPFTYPATGGNLLVDIQTNAASYSRAYFYGVNVPNVVSMCTYSWETYPQSFLPKTNFYVSSGCERPGRVATLTDSNSATLSWVGNGAPTFLIVMNGQEYYTTDTFYVFDNLDANTFYSGSLYGLCPGGDSTEVRPFSFRTQCGTTVLPLRENFEGYGTNLPSCWNVVEAGSYTNYPYVSESASNSHSGNHALYCYGYYTYQYFTTPLILQPVNTLEAKFWGKIGSNYYYNEPVVVGYVSTVDSMENFVAVDTVVIANDSWQEFTISFADQSYAGQGHISFRAGSGSYAGFYIDDIEVRQINDCADPTHFVQTGTATGSVSLAWQDSIASSWDVVAVPSGSDPDNADLVESTSQTSITLTGLEDTVLYDFYVRANCGSGDSYWVGPIINYPNLYMMAPNSHDTVSMCGGVITDDGGITGTYAMNQNTTLVIRPTSDDQAVVINGSVSVYSDSYTETSLKIYDGEGTTGRLIANITTSNPNVSAASTTGAITLKFQTPDYYTEAGFAFTVSCQELSSCPDPYDVEVSSIAGASALVSWGYGNNNPNSFAITVTDTATNTVLNFSAADTVRSFLMTGLEQATVYHVTVEADCGESSNPVGTYFTTTCLAGGNIAVDETTLMLNSHPINPYYKYSTCQVLYTADELFGIVDTIYGVSLYADNLNIGLHGPRNVNVYIDTTSATSLATAADFVVMNSSALRYSGQLNIVAGVNTFMFDTAFVLPNHNTNLVVTFDDNTGSWSEEAFWAGNGGHSNRVLYIANDNQNVDPTVSGNGTAWTDNRPVITFITPCADASCVAPGLVVSSVQPTSITLSWAPGSTENAWSVEYRAMGDTAWIMAAATTSNTSHTITGLQPATQYQFRVGSLCSSEDIPYSVVSSFTGCSVITSFPFTENFTNFIASGAQDALQPCWNRGYTMPYYGYGYAPYINDYYYLSAPNSLLIDGYSDSWIALPEMGVSLDSLVISFAMYGPSNYYDYGLVIGAMTNPADESTFVGIDTVFYTGSNASDWQTVEVGLVGAPSNARHIALWSYMDGAYIDNISVDIANPCPHPLRFTATTVGPNDITVAWTDTADVNSYKVLIGTGDNLATVFDSTMVTVNSATFTGLNRSTDYYFWIYAMCNPGQSNALTGRVTTMAVSPLSLPITLDFEDTSDYVFNFIQRSGTNAWTIGDAANAGHSLYISNDGGVSNAYEHSTTVALAFTPVTIPYDSVYSVSYEWRANGESYYDKLRAALVPAAYDLTTASTYYGDYGNYSDGSVLPSDWIALDNGYMSLQNNWQNFNGEITLTAGTYNFVFVWTNDGSGGSNPPAAIDNIDFRLLTCPAPTNVAPTNVTASVIDLAWNAGSASSWIVEYGQAGFTRGTGTISTVNTPSFSATGLTSNTGYTFYIAPICSSTDTGAASAVTISTGCFDGAIDEFPWVEDFESGISCWSQEYVDGSYDWAISDGDNSTNYAYSGENIALFASHSDDATMLITPMLNLGNASGEVLMTFYHVQKLWTPDQDTLGIYYRTSMADEWHYVTSWSDNISTWQLDSVMLPNPSATYQIGFLGYGTFGYGVGLDSIVVYGPEGCGAPAITSSSATFETITLNWAGSASSYEVAIKPAADLNWPAATAVTTTTYTFTGLYPSTEYDVRVRTICDDGTISRWAERTGITTDSLPCFAPTNVVTSNATVNSITVAWTNDAQSIAQAWVVNVFNATTNIMDTVRTNPATINGLYDNTQYSVAVQAMCAANFGSDWSDTVTFTTTSCQAVSNVNVTDITTSGAKVTWTAGANETAWEVSYGEMDFAEGQGVTVAATTTTYVITGLQADSRYDVYVRAKCADGITSDWSPVQQFQTLGNSQGIDGVEGNYSLSIYPNPTAGNTTISLRGVEGEVVITVVDMNGREITRDVMNCGSDCVKTMNVEGLAQGTYFVRVLGEGISSVRKLVVR